MICCSAKLLVFFQKNQQRVQVLRVNDSKTTILSTFSRDQFSIEGNLESGKTNPCFRYFCRLLNRALTLYP